MIWLWQFSSWPRFIPKHIHSTRQSSIACVRHLANLWTIKHLLGEPVSRQQQKKSQRESGDNAMNRNSNKYLIWKGQIDTKFRKEHKEESFNLHHNNFGLWCGLMAIVLLGSLILFSRGSLGAYKHVLMSSLEYISFFHNFVLLNVIHIPF